MKENEIVKYWLEEIIIGLNLCPFAKAPFEKGLIDIEMCPFLEEKKRTEYLITAIEKLLLSKDVEYNLIVVFPRLISSFEDFYEWVVFVEGLLKRNKLDSLVQLVAFHPEFHFEHSKGRDDRADLVNSSPFPIIHLLKTESISHLNLSPNDAEKISSNNEDKLKKLSKEKINELFFWKK